MSFLRKKSQRSFVNGNDEITVRKVSSNSKSIVCRTETFHSDSSSPPDIDTADYALHESCVLRNFPKHKSSHLRFLAWVAYTRKFTDESITDDERKTCPLLWCREVFPDQDTMLHHVWDCEHLSKGLYWCFHCQRPERVGKFQCKRCQGLPSRTDRLATVAKKIFSKLGSKHRTQHQFPAAEPEMALARYSEISKSLTKSGQDEPAIYDAGPAEDYFDMQELSSTATEFVGGWVATSQELPDTQISEMIGSEVRMELSASAERWLDEQIPAHDNWYMPEVPVMSSNPVPRSPRRFETMLAPLNTQSLNPNKRHFPQVYPSNWSDEPMSATIISPMSPSDGFVSFRAPAPTSQTVSPTDSDASGKSFFTDSGYTSATVDSLSSLSMVDFELNSSFNEPRGKKRFRDWDNHGIDSTITNFPPPQLTSPSEIDQPQDSQSSSHSPSRCPSTKKPKLQSPHWSNPKTLIQSFSEVLAAHLAHTKAILRQLPPTPTGIYLLDLSNISLVSMGLSTLSSIIKGKNPQSIVEMFAFTHLAYAFSIAIDHDEIKVHTQEWFQDSLSWIRDLRTETARAKTEYMEIARAVWEPVDGLREGSLPNMHRSRGGGENRLFLACKRFLDVFESFGSSPFPQSAEKTFDFSQPLFAQNAKIRVIDELIKTVSIEAFIEDVVKVEKRLLRGHIGNVRELELELMCAGKQASQSDQAYTRFLQHVTNLCNSLYFNSSGISPSRSRSSYYHRDIEVVKEMLSDRDWDEENAYGDDDECDERDGDLEFEEELEDDLPAGFEIHLDAIEIRTHSATSNPSKESIHPRKPNAKSNQDINRTDPGKSMDSQDPKIIQKEDESSTSIIKCPYCPYVPQGNSPEEYKRSNLRRHKKAKHPSLAGKKEYKCEWPGCGSTFNRSDNLKSHGRDKGHIISKGKEKEVDRLGNIILKGKEKESGDGRGKRDELEDQDLKIRENNREGPRVKRRKGGSGEVFGGE